ncbi:ATP-binding protein [Lysobacter sp. FW306-1B-D06B]|uniref:sensor histidine kinase n=1 Tax=Lysobacter sp. FW306-1B-D06B TaxID=3140250 RepID=UPI00314030DF
MVDAPAPRESGWRRWANRIQPAWVMVLVSPLMICFAWIVTFDQISKDRNAALAEGYREANGLSRSFAEMARHNLDDLDQIVRVVRRAYVAGMREDDIARMLTRAGFRESHQVQVAVLDASNRIIAGKGPDAPQWLAKAMPQRNDGPAVDRPVFSTALRAERGRPDLLAFSRPILRRDGALAGHVAVFVRPEQVLASLPRLNVGPMARQFGSIELGRDDVAAILGMDGRLRAVRLGGAALAASRWPEGPAIYRTRNGDIQPRPNARLDAVPRLWSGGYLRAYDATIVVGISRGVVLRGFERRRQLYLAGTTAFTLGVGLLTVMGAILARRQRRILQQLAESERRANELKSSFLAKISHDLRTPLNGILGFAELIKITAHEEEPRQYGEYIHDSASHLLDLVNMILDLTKLRNGTLQLQLREVDLKDIATSVSRTHSVVAEGKCLEYRLQIAPDFPAAVLCDGVRIREVLNNLAHNAIKFTRAGKVSMELFTADERVMVRVSDTGIGMSDEVKQHLFEPFSEGRDAESRLQAGSGLGLAFSKELLALHGGGIEVASTQGQGTDVTFWIPRDGPPAPPTSPTQ